jgi:hypothetical protein
MISLSRRFAKTIALGRFMSGGFGAPTRSGCTAALGRDVPTVPLQTCHSAEFNILILPAPANK